MALIRYLVGVFLAEGNLQESSQARGFHFSMDQTTYNEIAEEVKKYFPVCNELQEDMGTQMRKYKVQYPDGTVDPYVPQGSDGNLMRE